MKILILPLVFFSTALFASRVTPPTIRAAQTCEVLAHPETHARPVCQLKALTPLTKSAAAENGFWRVEADRCRGYVLPFCLPPEARVLASGRGVANEDRAAPNPYRLALSTQFDYSIAKVPYDDSSSSGLGYGAGIRFDLPLADAWRVSLNANYQVLKLTHTVDGSGYITDTNPAVFSQKRGYADLGAIFGYEISRREPADNISWWAEGGLNFLLPRSGSQSSPAGDTSFSNTDKLLFASLGLASNIPISETWAVLANLRFDYNLGSTGGSKLYGLRFGLAVGFEL